MSPSAVRRVALAAVATPAGLLAALVLSAGPAGAHTVDGGSLPAPPWLLGYVGAFAVLVTAVALRSSWPTPRLRATEVADPAAAAVAAEPRLHVGHAVGTTAFALVVLAAVVGVDSAAANVAPVAVLVWWLTVPVLALVAGDVVALVNPFQLPAALGRAGARAAHHGAGAPTWTAAAFLAALCWYFLAYHRPGSPRALAVLLVAYALAALAGALRWGRGWLSTGEGLAGLSAAVARLSWRRSEAPVPGMAALAVVWIGAAAFDGFASTSFWGDVVGSSQGWSRTMLHTAGLVWVTALVGGAYLLALRIADRRAAGAAPLVGPAGLALVPLGFGWFVAHELTLLLIEAQNLVILVSDPLGRGWDLFGTVRGFDASYEIVRERWVRWLQLVVLLGGHLGAVVLAHDVALRWRRRSAAVAITAAMAVLASASLLAAAQLVLG